MKISSTTIFFAVIFHFSLITLQAQEPWSLEKCISFALENNIQIKQQKLNTEYNANLFKQSKIALYPNLNANSSYGISFGRALDQTTYEFTENQTIQSLNLGLSSSVTLFSGLQKWNIIEQNRLDLLASLKDLEKLKNDISMNIAASYLQILFSEELVNVANEQLNVTSQQVGRTKVLVDAGSVARGNLLEMQAQEAADEVTLVSARNNLDISYLTLSQLLELTSQEDFKIVIPEITTIPEEEILISVQDVFNDALAEMPQIQSAAYILESSEKGLSIAKGSRSPQLGLSAQYGSGYSDIRQQVINTVVRQDVIGQTTGGEDVIVTSVAPEYGPYPFGNQVNDNANLSVYLNLSVPIFNNFQIRTNISNASLMVKTNSLELENRKKILYKEIQQAYADAVAAFKNYTASEKAVAFMEESFMYTNEKYDVGLINAVDFNIAQNQLTITRSDLLKAKYDYIFKINILNFYRGKELKLEY